MFLYNFANKDTKMRRLILSITTLAICSITIANAARIQTISSHEGLSNNAIFTIYQDDLGILYLGTMDGLNIWDGQKMEQFHAADGKPYFAGNKVRHIFPINDENIYVLTTYGLARVNTRTKHVLFYEEFSMHSMVCITQDDNIFSLDKNHCLQYFDRQEKKLSKIEDFSLDLNDYCIRMLVTKDKNLYIFSYHGTYRIEFDYSQSVPKISRITNLNSKYLFVSKPHDNGPIYLINEAHEISTFDKTDGSIHTLTKFTLPNVNRVHSINGIVKSNKGWYIGFWDGVWFLENGSEKLVKTDMSHSLFAMTKDRYQPIIWIGTDSNGLIKWSNEDASVNCITYDNLPYYIEMPVRCLYMDKHDGLWFGTKGNGLFHIKDFHLSSKYDETNTDRYNTSNSKLIDNNVYCLTQSSLKEGVFIGTEGSGLNWYSRNKGLQKVSGSHKLHTVYSITEQNSSTIWITTGNSKVYKCHLGEKNDIPTIARIDSIDFYSPIIGKVSFYSSTIQNDSILWLGSRGNGAVSYNLHTGEYRSFHFPKEYGFASDEILHINGSKNMYFATRNSLAIYDTNRDSVTVSRHFSNESTRSVLTDDADNIYVSTNSGITILDSSYNFVRSYGRFSGMQILEYSDGACYFNYETRETFFGGINGFTVLKGDHHITDSHYMPPIHITSIKDNNTEIPLASALKKGKLHLPYSKSSFGVNFLAIDHENPYNYVFFYNIEGLNNTWNEIENNTIDIATLPPGRYKLRIKYICRGSGAESEIYILPIRISPPFYRSILAYFLYIILCCLGVFWQIKRNKIKYKTMQENLRKQYVEQIRNIKSETGAAISEDISVTTTFILGLCQQIRSRVQNIPTISEKVDLVESSINKISRTLNIWQELRNMKEDGLAPQSSTLLSISRVSDEILKLASIKYKNKKIALKYNIPQNLVVTTDKETFIALLNTLTNIVFSTTSVGGSIEFEASRLRHDKVMIKFQFNTDKYTYQLFKDGENGLILCQIQTKDLPIDITCNYDSEKMTATTELILSSLNTTNIVVKADSLKESNSFRETIYIVSKNDEIIQFLQYFLSEKYNISIFNNNESIISSCSALMPCIVIYDTSSLQKQIDKFMKLFKANKNTSQIPVAALVSSLDITEKETCLKAGCDHCTAFPFSTETFLATIDKLIGQKSLSVEYYNSPDSSFLIQEGKAVHQDDVRFLRKVVEIIDANISNPNLTAPMIAEQLSIGTRILYKKLEELSDKPLRKILIETRIRHATKLLTSTKLSVEEIMYKTGHDNASTFHRNFKAYHGVTPKEYRKNLPPPQSNP